MGGVRCQRRLPQGEPDLERRLHVVQLAVRAPPRVERSTRKPSYPPAIARSLRYKCQNLCYVQTWDGDCGPNGEGCGGAVDLSIYYDENEIKELLFNTTSDDQCHCIDDDKESWSNLSTIGIIFTLSFTYIGFFLLTTGVMWNAQIVQKLGKVRSQYVPAMERCEASEASETSAAGERANERSGRA